jgi:hypothetical protein
MTQARECGVETTAEGTEMCTLHKKPLEETTVLEEVKEGKLYPNINKSFVCPVSGKFLRSLSFERCAALS